MVLQMPFTPGYFVPSLVEIGSVVFEKLKIGKFTDGQADRQTMTKGDQKSSLELSAQVS